MLKARQISFNDSYDPNIKSWLISVRQIFSVEIQIVVLKKALKLFFI